MTTGLTLAILTRLNQIQGSGKKSPPSYKPDPNGSYEVQFNPTSLKLSRSNNIDKGGATTRTQKRQAPSVQPATLSFDLEFDTAEGEGGQPKDVRELTRIVRQFAEPVGKDKSSEPPPAVLFQWGRFRFQGIVTQLTEDLDYFSSDGLPLRAKLSVTITEQNPEWEATKLGPAARRAPASESAAPRSTSPGGPAAPAPVPGTGPGSAPAANPISTALAQAGESVQQVLSRLDADPATWRSATAGLDSPLSLEAGAQVQLSASASASAGLGASGTLSASAEARAGFSLAEAGGVGQAQLRADASLSASAQAGARASFSVPELRASVQAGSGARATADPRSLGYGRSVPLRARVSGV